MAHRLAQVPADELGRVPGAPELQVTEDLLRRLPAEAPPAPWECRISGLTWIQRTGGGAVGALPDPLRGTGRPRWGLGSFLRYLDSPVGAYDELQASLLQRSGVHLRNHVPFIVVDSLASLRGGRVNWALPKALAKLTGDPAVDQALSAAGDGWWVRAQLRAAGPRLPIRAALSTRQVLPDGSVGTFRASFRGRVRLARVRVEMAPGLSVGTWLRPGTHVGIQWLDTRLLVQPLLR